MLATLKQPIIKENKVEWLTCAHKENTATQAFNSVCANTETPGRSASGTTCNQNLIGPTRGKNTIKGHIEVNCINVKYGIKTTLRYSWTMSLPSNKNMHFNLNRPKSQTAYTKFSSSVPQIKDLKTLHPLFLLVQCMLIS